MNYLSLVKCPPLEPSLIPAYFLWGGGGWMPRRRQEGFNPLLPPGLNRLAPLLAYLAGAIRFIC